MERGGSLGPILCQTYPIHIVSSHIHINVIVPSTRTHRSLTLFLTFGFSGLDVARVLHISHKSYMNWRFISILNWMQEVCSPLCYKLEELTPKLSEYRGSWILCLQFNILTHYLKLDWVFLWVVLIRIPDWFENTESCGSGESIWKLPRGCGLPVSSSANREFVAKGLSNFLQEI